MIITETVTDESKLINFYMYVICIYHSRHMFVRKPTLYMSFLALRYHIPIILHRRTALYFHINIYIIYCTLTTTLLNTFNENNNHWMKYAKSIVLYFLQFRCCLLWCIRLFNTPYVWWWNGRRYWRCWWPDAALNEYLGRGRPYRMRAKCCVRLCYFVNILYKDRWIYIYVYAYKVLLLCVLSLFWRFLTRHITFS